MTKENGINLFKLIIKNNGRPSTKELINTFGTTLGTEISRRLYIADFAVYTNEKLVTMATTALKKFGGR